MLARIKMEIGTNAIPKMTIVHEEEEEEVDNTWYPGESTIKTLKSLKFFVVPEDEDLEGADGNELTKKEARDSYTNFDRWLITEVGHIVSLEKEEDEKLFK